MPAALPNPKPRLRLMTGRWLPRSAVHHRYRDVFAIMVAVLVTAAARVVRLSPLVPLLTFVTQCLTSPTTLVHPSVPVYFIGLQIT